LEGEDSRVFKGSGDNSERVKIHKILKNLRQNQQAKVNQTWYKLSLDDENSSIFK
jgi:hypothetical protein